MSFTFNDLQIEVLRRATKNQSGGQFTSAIKNVINTSLFRLSRECNWKQLRRITGFPSDITQSNVGSITSVNNGSTSMYGSGLNLITNKIRVGRRIQIQGSTQRYIIASILSENDFTVNLPWDGTTYGGTGNLTYTIFGTEDYTLPIQAGRIGLIWHEAYGYPFMMRFVTDFDFYTTGIVLENNNRPIYWRQWGEDDVLSQPGYSSALSLSSSDSADTAVSVTVYGTVSGYPDQETIITDASDGTIIVTGTKAFSKVERITKDDTVLQGRITVTGFDWTGSPPIILPSGSAEASSLLPIAVIPSGSIQNKFSYKHIQVWPLPNSTFNFNVMYYKDPGTLINNNDIHELGYQFDEAIILLATSKLKFEQNQLKEGESFAALYADEVKNLKQYNADTLTNWSPALRRPRNARDLTGGSAHRFLTYSQLGGSFGPAWNN